MVGSAIVKHLLDAGHPEVKLILRRRSDLDLSDQSAVRKFFADVAIDEVYLAAAKVGGILANDTYPASFIYENLMIEANVIDAAFRAGVKKLLFLGSSCIYPRLASQPIFEDELLSGPLEPTNEPYAIAKIAGIKLCESYNRQYGSSHGVDFRSIMPTNLFGPGDNYDPENSHVVPALLRRFHDAKAAGADVVVVWGTGRPRREFLYVDDVASACLHIMNLDAANFRTMVGSSLNHINIGFGEDVSIADLAYLVASIVGYTGKIVFDASKPDGTPRKLLDSSRARSSGWEPKIGLADGLRLAYHDFLNNWG